jgi:uncharacterized membrane protein
MIHVLAAVVWVGSMIFFSLVVMPSMREAVPPPQRPELIRALGRRYRVVGWTGLLVLLTTGPLLALRGGVAWNSGYGHVLGFKVALVGVMVVLTLLHDLVLGPRAAQGNPSQQQGRRTTVLWLARINLLAALAILFCAVWLNSV